MPGMDGARTIAEIRDGYPSVPLIVLSGADPALDARACLRAGAAGFIPKSAMSKVMLQAIQLVLAGGQYLPPQLLHLLDRESDVSHVTAPATIAVGGPEHERTIKRQRLDLLSKRQREVFALLAQGLSNKMIARELNVTEGTVKSHIATIFDVLNVHNRVAAVAVARKLAGDAEVPGRHGD